MAKKQKIEKHSDSEDSGDDQCNHDHDDDENNDHGHSHAGGDHGHSHGGGKKQKGPPPSKTKTVIKFLILMMIVPAFYLIPVVLKSAGEIVSNNRVYLIYIWSVYIAILSVLVYLKRHLISLSSFVNQNLIWLIFTLGVFIVLDIPKMIQQVDLRTEVLFVWCTLTMIPNLIIFSLDDTDHKTLERLEEEKEQRKKKKEAEKKKKKDERKKAKLEEKMKQYTPMKRFLMNAGVYACLLLLVALLGWQTYRWYLRTQQNIQDRIRNPQTSPDIMNDIPFDIED
ncbi:hypothetical protein CYY_006097 [Polysphondylium violaceum]|uniref:Uncharacterized protein n=1 Tax=Polysphondylium violaceum TaxID=133409 RepID=A0A8J4UYE1_9MYCE|nr:hypothetical protein CYY_006097 [Polysphondylium violaceum]